MLSVRARLLPGFGLALIVLVGLAVTVGLHARGWLAGTACDIAILALLGQALSRSDLSRRRPADQVTLARGALIGGVTALVADSLGRSLAGPPLVALVALGTVALALDGSTAGWRDVPVRRRTSARASTWRSTRC